MIVLYAKLNNALGFVNFNINFSCPKKIVNSIIEDEHLLNRTNFRYKKVVISFLKIIINIIMCS